MSLMNGLGKMAEGISGMALVYQKDLLEQDKMKLANEFAEKRDEKNRDFQRGERLETQAHNSGEKVLDRDQQMKITTLQMENAVKTAQISAAPGHARVALEREQFTAGAPLRAAQLEGVKADTSLKEKTAANYDEEHKARVDLFKAQTKAYDAKTILEGIQTDALKMVTEAKTELTAAEKANDPAAIETARKKLQIANMGANDGQQQVSAALSEAKLWEVAFKETQQRLVIMQDPTKTMTPAGEKLVKELERQYAEQVRAFNAAAKEAARLRQQYQIGGTQTTAPPVTGAPTGVDIKDVLFPGKEKPPAQAPAPEGNPLMQMPVSP